MKKIISLFLTVTMIASLIVAIPATTVVAAETITDEALFMTYPTYLSNSEMDEGLAKAEAAFRAVMSSYSKTDELIAAFMTAMSEGISLSIQDYLGKLGLTETFYEKYAREAATKYIQSMLSNPNAATEPTKKIDTAYKALKTSYSVGSSVDKTKLMADLKKVATDYDISVAPKDMEELVDNLYDAGSLKDDLDAIGESMKLWKVVLELTEIHAIEKSAIVFTMNELQNAGLSDSDLYLGLSLLKSDIEKSPAEYVLKHYGTDKVVSYIAEKADDLIFTFATGTTIVPLVNAFTNLFSNYVYVNAKADALIQASMQASFVSCLDICLSKYRTKFINKQGTSADANKYKFLYSSYLGAYKAVLDSCYDVAKIGDKFSLGGDCMIWSSNIKDLYTYDNYIKWCKEEIAHDIKNAELDKTTGDSTITDALNEETIKARLDKIMSLYPAGNTWAGDFMGVSESLGYVCKNFNHIFDTSMVGMVQDDYRYILKSNVNVRLIGRLEDEGVTETALKELFSKARVGDVIITSGQYDYLHAMMLVEVGENGPVVYDVGSKYGPEQDPYKYTWLIQKYEFPYSKMADSFSKNGEYMTKPGISIYRAIKKVNTTNSGTSIYYEEYDDSVNYVIENGVLKGYKGSRTTIEIPDGVTSIAANCFKNNKSIKYVYMPDTITEIGRQVFYGCSNLRYVKLSKNLSFLAGMSFGNCSLLTGIIIPKSLESCDYEYLNQKGGPFYGCSALKNVEFEEGITKIPDYLFDACNGIESISLPDTVVEIGYESFNNCSKLIDVRIPDSVTKIGNSAFKNCTVLGEVILPDSVIEIERFAFYGCTNLRDVYLSENLSILEGMSFGNCNSLTSIAIPKTLESCNYEWSNNQKGGPFYGCSALKNVEFEEGITKIPDYLFDACNGIESISLPDTVVEIGYESFNNCSKLIDVRIPDSVIILGDSVFRECASLKNVILSNKLQSIGGRVFNNCSSLTEINIPDSVTLMGAYIFYGCTSLEKVKLPNIRKNIMEYMFYNCSALKEIDLPETVTNINNYAFYGCKSLPEIDLPNSLTNIGSSAFYECKALSEITIPENVTSIGSSAFQNCDALTKAEIKGSGSIGSKAFYDCDLLERINIGDKITSIGSNMCYGCDKLTDIKLGKGITTIPDSAFRLCQSLETVTIPRFCTTIAANAFAENTKLSSAYIPVSVTSMQNNSFSYPAKMTMYGKAGSYAEEYANSRSMAFASLDAPITTLAYPESSMNIGYRATVTPDMYIIPAFDTDAITFTSADTNIATVSTSGAVYGKSYGTTTITMTASSGVSDSIEVTVIRPATSLALSNTGFELAVGNTEVLTVTINPTNSTDIIKWSSDNTDVAIVDDKGNVTAISKGTANITATAVYGNKSASCLVTVVESNVPIVNVTGITLNCNEKEITIGKTYTLKANVLPQDATNKLIEWTTSNSSVADVEDGVVTTKSLGEATITAKTVSGGFVATCKVTVVPKVEITAFTATNYGPYAFINLSVVNAPATAKVYIASYDNSGKLLELQSPTLSNGVSSAIFLTADVFNYKAFIWKGDAIKPLSELKEYVFK